MTPPVAASRGWTTPLRGVATASLVTLGLQGIATGTSFVSTLLLARLLGTGGYGQVAYAITVATVLTVGTKLGLDSSLVRSVAVARARGDEGAIRGLVRWASTSAIGCALAVATIVTGAAWWLAEPAPARDLAAAMGLLVVMTWVTVPTAALRGLDRPILAALPLQFVRPLVLLAGIGVLIATAAAEPLWALGVVGMSYVAAAVALALAWRAHRPAVAPARVDPRPLLRSVPALVLLAAASTLVVQADLLVLQALTTDATVGIYAVVAQLVRLVGLPLAVVNKVVAPRFAADWSQHALDRVQQTAAMSALGVAALTLPIAAALWVGGAQLLGWFGADFMTGAAVLPVLLAGQLVNTLCGSVGTLLLMCGRERDVGIVSAGAAALNIGLDVWLVPSLGILGAAIGSTAALCFFNLALVVRVRTTLGIDTTVLGLWHR